RIGRAAAESPKGGDVRQPPSIVAKRVQISASLNDEPGNRPMNDRIVVTVGVGAVDVREKIGHGNRRRLVKKLDINIARRPWTGRRDLKFDHRPGNGVIIEVAGE